MSSPLFNSFTAGALLVGATVGFFAHDYFTTIEKPAPTGDRGTEVSDALPNPLRAENQRLLGQLEELRQDLARRAVEAPKKVEATPVPESDASTTPTQEVPLDFDEMHDLLAKIDWTVVGANMKDMVPMLAKMGEAIANGETPDLEVMGNIQRLNADLMTMAQLINEAKVPGTGINGAFTHPALVANQFSAALKAAGKELNPDQQHKLDRLMREFSARDQNLRLVEGDREFALESLLEEVSYKNDFYAQSKALLSDEQRATLYNEKSEGRSQLDMFDTSLMLAGLAKPIRASGPAEFAKSASAGLERGLKLGEGPSKQLASVIAEWTKGLPPNYWDTKADAMEQRGLMRSKRMRNALRRQLALTRMIVNRVDLTPEQRAQLLKNKTIMVPLPR